MTSSTPRIDAVGLVTGDLSRSRAFYRLLGTHAPELAPDDDSGHVECDLGPVRLMLDTEETMVAFAPDTWSGGGPGRLVLAARCSDAAEVDRLHAQLAALGRGSHVAPYDAPWGQRYATVLDPDGVHVDLYAPLAVDT